MDLSALLALILVCVGLAIFLSGVSFSRIPGPLWHLPFLGETLEFMDSPIKVRSLHASLVPLSGGRGAQSASL